MKGPTIGIQSGSQTLYFRRFVLPIRSIRFFSELQAAIELSEYVGLASFVRV
jgi:hypothetical protein